MLKFKDNDKYLISNYTYKIHPIFVYIIFKFLLIKRISRRISFLIIFIIVIINILSALVDIFT